MSKRWIALAVARNRLCRVWRRLTRSRRARPTARPCARSISASRSRRRTWCTPRPMSPRSSASSPSAASTPTSSSSRAASRRPRTRPPCRARPSSAVSDVADRQRHEGAAVLGPRAAHAAGLYGVARRQDRQGSQGQAALGDRRRRRRLQLAHGPRGAQDRRPHRRRRAVHRVRHRGPAAGPGRRPDRRRGAASGGRVPGQEAEADAQSPRAARRPDAQLHVQLLRRLARLDRARPRAAAAIRPPP